MPRSEPAEREVWGPSPREDFPLSVRPGFLLHKAALLMVEDAEAALATIDMRARDFFVLACLSGEPKLSQQDLSRLLNLDPTTVVSVIDEMERNRHVERQRDPSDRRRYHLFLTDAGRDSLVAADRAVTEAEVRFFGVLAQDERVALRGMLSQLLEGRWPASVCED